MKTNDYINIGEEISDFENSFDGTVWKYYSDKELTTLVTTVTSSTDENTINPNIEDNVLYYVTAANKNTQDNTGIMSQPVGYIPTITEEEVSRVGDEIASSYGDNTTENIGGESLNDYKYLCLYVYGGGLGYLSTVDGYEEGYGATSFTWIDVSNFNFSSSTTFTITSDTSGELPTGYNYGGSASINFYVDGEVYFSMVLNNAGESNSNASDASVDINGESSYTSISQYSDNGRSSIYGLTEEQAQAYDIRENY